MRPGAAAAPPALDLPRDLTAAAALVDKAWRGIVIALPTREVIESALGIRLARHCERGSGTTYLAGVRVFRCTLDGETIEAADLMTVVEAAKVYGCARRTVQSAIERGALTGRRLGDSWVLTPADLATWAPAAGPGWKRGVRRRPVVGR